MGAVLGGLDKDRYDRQYSDRYLFGRLWQYMQPYRRQFYITSAMGLVFALLFAASPILISIGVEQLEVDATVEVIMVIVGALGVAAVVQYAANWLQRRTVARLLGHVIADVRKDAFAASLDRDMAFYDENKTGKVLSRITSDTEEFIQIMLLSTQLVSQIVQVFVLLSVLISRNVMLTAIMLAFLLPILLATTFFRYLARQVTRQGSRAMAEVNGTIQETVTGISVAKNFRQEALIYDDFVKTNTQSYTINMKRGTVIAMIFPVLNVMAGFAAAAVIYFGAELVLEGVIAIGMWYLYIQSVDRFWFPIINLASYWSQFQQAMSALERIFALIDADNTVVQQADQPVQSLDGEITFENVGFAYKTGQSVLQDFTLTIQQGESVAFVGHTGAGKSSIVKLIMRMYEFQQGTISVDGRNIRDLNLQAYRSQLGFVPQTPYLFSGTIADNIRYANPEASDQEVRELAYSIGNGEWLENLPEGLQSPVGERGSRLSIGQRQLVSLLRVLMQKPAIFILDEATASVDNFTEAQIQEALDRILAQSTSILIAHRLSTVRSADRIIVLNQGGIIEQGSHQDLLDQNGHYAELYNTYFRHQSLAYAEQSRRFAKK